MGKNFVRCMEMYGVEVKDEVSWVGDIFGCKQKIIFGKVGANDHEFWNILWGISKGCGGVAKFMELRVASLRVRPRSVRLWVPFRLWGGHIVTQLVQSLIL